MTDCCTVTVSYTHLDVYKRQGQHGEGGGGRQPLKCADETAQIMLDGLISDLDIKSGEKIMLILNGTGATTLMELFIIYRKCVSYLKEKNIEIVANYVGCLLYTSGNHRRQDAVLLSFYDGSRHYGRHTGGQCDKSGRGAGYVLHRAKQGSHRRQGESAGYAAEYHTDQPAGGAGKRRYAANHFICTDCGDNSCKIGRECGCLLYTSITQRY